jgi:hypothetical protein
MWGIASEGPRQRYVRPRSKHWHRGLRDLKFLLYEGPKCLLQNCQSLIWALKAHFQELPDGYCVTLPVSGVFMAFRVASCDCTRCHSAAFFLVEFGLSGLA